ncbi:serine hydrolase domain-containing protein [Croceitalea rosinachiae]|uniref:Serine hydrolase domain-containing protein n=1 Tax=Croceitalea rosinachiae TaxID=3075596 RepID=A0ABU3A7R7_9FLAO|nr:serine hydrolase domain-containing protein [Croceitalea sp. F388]MDT0605612.1 serine hydrolase domain-containing protein [Croceitalea sp. F388]
MKLSNTLQVLLVILLLSSCRTEEKEVVAIEKFQFATPEELGMATDSLSKIDEMVMEFVEAKKYPGAVTLIAKNGKIIYESEVGWSDSTKTEPYRKDHLFRMASMTKPIVSVAAMQLVEAGKLNLDDPVGKYIPSFIETEILTDFNPVDTTWTSISSKNSPTVRQLLTQTAGVPYGFMNPSLNGAILAKHSVPDLSTHLPITIKETASKLGDLPLMHEPGTQWMYGLNTDVLGRVVEVASGMELDDYIRENITKPIGIERLDFYFNDSLTPKLAKVFLGGQDGEIVQAPENMGPFYIPNYPTKGAKKYLSGGSGMTGTARDYFLFCQAMLNNGKLGDGEILKPETAQAMHEVQLDTITFPWGSGSFGYGFHVAEGETSRPNGTYSWGGAFSTTFWIDPSNKLVVIQLRQVLQSPHNQEIDGRLEKLVYNALKN